MGEMPARLAVKSVACLGETRNLASLERMRADIDQIFAAVAAEVRDLDLAVRRTRGGACRQHLRERARAAALQDSPKFWARGPVTLELNRPTINERRVRASRGAHRELRHQAGDSRATSVR